MDFLPLTQTFEFKTSEIFEEQYILDKINSSFVGLSEGAERIINFSFLEMMNNVLEHAESKNVIVKVSNTDDFIGIEIKDDGIGVFRSVQQYLKFPEPKYSIIELQKGKFTTKPDTHAGEGIFMTSKMCDKFIIMSENLFYAVNEDEMFKSDYIKGTSVFFCVNKHTTKKPSDTFNEYSLAEPDKDAFYKTNIKLNTMVIAEGHDLVSRSEGRRLCSGLEKFKEIIFDFSGVKFIEQGFADEVFRVFPSFNTDIKISVKNISPAVKKMISHVRGDRVLPELFFI